MDDNVWAISADWLKSIGNINSFLMDMLELDIPSINIIFHFEIKHNFYDFKREQNNCYFIALKSDWFNKLLIESKKPDKSADIPAIILHPDNEDCGWLPLCEIVFRDHTNLTPFSFW